MEIVLEYLDVWWIRVSIALGAALVAYWVVMAFFSQAKKKASRTSNLMDDAIIGAAESPASYGVLLVALGSIIKIIDKEFEPNLLLYRVEAIYITVSILVAWFFLRLIRIRENQILKGRVETKTDQTTITAISKLLRLVVIVLTALVCLQTLGFSLSGVIAFGGVGGAAVAFAAKDLLANFFGGFMVYMDKPFLVGDWIRSPDQNIEGTVEYIGWRITRIRTFDKRPLYVPNSVFAQISIENPSRMTNRRIYETIGVRYSDFSVVDKICKEVDDMLSDHPDIDNNQTLMVNFNRFADSSLEFFIYAFTHTTNWQEFHRIKQKVLIQVGEIIEANGAEIAFPAQSIYMETPVEMQSIEDNISNSREPLRASEQEAPQASN